MSFRPDENLLRAIPPGWVNSSGVIATDAFYPTRRDGGVLTAWREWVDAAALRAMRDANDPPRKTKGVTAVQPAEVEAAGPDVVDDAHDGNGHVGIDFRGLDEELEWTIAATRLACAATARGFLPE